MFLRNFLVDLYSSVQRMREWRILDHRNVVLLRDLADLAGDQIDAFGDADRRVHTALIS